MPFLSRLLAPGRFRRTIVLLAATIVPVTGRAQDYRFTLRDALGLAATGAVPNRAARAASDAAAAARMGAWRTIFPTLRVDAGFVRTNDPTAAFGTSNP